MPLSIKPLVRDMDPVSIIEDDAVNGLFRDCLKIPPHAPVTFFILPLHKRFHFGITNRPRTSEEVSGLLVESSQRLLASNSEQPPTDPFPGFAFGNKVS